MNSYISLHESAHAIVETILVDDCEFVSIVKEQGRGGTMQGYPYKPQTPVVCALAALYAGMCAETMLADIEVELARSHAVDDFAQVEELVAKHGDTPEERHDLRYRSMTLAMEVVHECADEIELLAAQLEYHKRVSGAHVRELLVQSPKELWKTFGGKLHGFTSCSDYVNQAIKENASKQ
jgi:hypothetical protein